MLVCYTHFFHVSGMEVSMGFPDLLKFCRGVYTSYISGTGKGVVLLIVMCYFIHACTMYAICLSLVYFRYSYIHVFLIIASQTMFLLAALVFGASKSLIGFGQFTLPLSFEKPPISPIVTMHTFCSGGILALDVHPTKRYVSVL